MESQLDKTYYEGVFGVDDDEEVDLINLNTVKELQATIAELNATIERLRSELDDEKARTICATCGEELTRMAKVTP